MRITITTYDNNGNEIVSRNYNLENDNSHGETLDSIIADSYQYLEEQAVDYKEPNTN